MIDQDTIVIIDDDTSGTEYVEDADADLYEPETADASQIRDTPPATQTPPTQSPQPSQEEKDLRCFRIVVDVSSPRMPKRPRPEDIDTYYSKRKYVSEPFNRTRSFGEESRDAPVRGEFRRNF